MIYAVLIFVCIITIIAAKKQFFKYDDRGFDRNGTHKNGTKFDNFGFDIDGYDQKGYSRNGYNRNGYDKNGYNIDGYNYYGKNEKNQYNRMFDNDAFDTENEYSKDGFRDPDIYDIEVTNHARTRIAERMRGGNTLSAERLAYDAYRFGKSARQIKRTSAALVKEIEHRYDNSVVLIYRGYIYVFSSDNVLITVYKNETIPL